MHDSLDPLKILEFYKQIGIQEAIADVPINYLDKPNIVSQNKETPKITEKPPMPPRQKTIIQSPHELLVKTQKIADDCKTIADLKKAVESFKDLSICKTATNVVFGDGNFDSDIMFIGEAPGADEDLQGIPFCGASGKMLESALSYIGLKRSEDFYITNTLFWRPPGNRKPTSEELMICKPFVQKHIALFKPKIIILIGATSVVSLLEVKEGITKIRGKIFDYKNQYIDKSIPATPIFHPSYLLRSPGQKYFFWQDLLKLKNNILV